MKRALIVEPDSLLRALIAEWLLDGGMHVVYPAASIAPVDIDAVLVDLANPEHGRSVLRPWRVAYPDAAIIAMSGRFTARETGDSALASCLGATSTLALPFTRQELFAALRLEGVRPSQRVPTSP